MADKPATIELTVFAAASLTDAFEEAGEQWEAAHPGARLRFNFAGSQQLARQLVEGAPADLFASANVEQMDVVVASGRVAASTVQPFARNQLLLIVPADNPAGLESVADLARLGLKIVLASEEVPVGRYTGDFLERAAASAGFGPAFRDGVLANVVSYEQNVRAVFSKVALGEADAGIVYRSDIASAQASQVRELPLPAALNPAALYPIAPLADSEHAALAASFVTFIRSEAGQEILARYGFLPLSY